MKMKNVRHRMALILAGVIATMSLAGCGMLSDETEGKSKEAVCASADASVESLKAGGSGAKAVASLIYDLADDEAVKDAAAKVRDGNMDQQAVDTLITWVGEVC